MKLYVLLAGVKNQCESVRGIFSSIDKIEKAIPDIPFTFKRANGWERVEPRRWECKNEYLTVEEMELDDNIFSFIEKDLDALVDHNFNKDGSSDDIDRASFR